MTELGVAIGLGLLLLVGREIVSHEYDAWAGFLAKALVRLAGRLDRSYRDEWWAELHEVQEVRHESGLGFAVGALLSGVRSVAKVRGRKPNVEALSVPVAPIAVPGPTPRRRSRRGSATAEELGRRVRRERSRQGLTTEELGERAGMHRTYIGHLERGEVNPTLFSIVVVATALGVDPARLVAGLSGPDEG